MCANNRNRIRGKVSLSVAAYAMAIVVTAAYSDRILAQHSTPEARTVNAGASSLRVAELESAFWACDHAATLGGVLATPVELCSTVTEELKNTRFGGNFGEMVTWWQANKAAEHGRRIADRR